MNGAMDTALTCSGCSNDVNSNSKREYGIDLLKIIAMCMIVGFHILQQGLDYTLLEPYTVKWFAADFLMAMLICHVNIYALISGYVKSGQKNRFRKACSLWIVVFFYSMSSYLLEILLGKDVLSFRGIVKCIALFISGKYWYFTAYCGLLVIAPYLTQILDKMDMISLRKFLYGVLAFWGIGGWIGGLAASGKIIGAYEGFSTAWLAVMYCVGYAIKKYGSEIIFFTKKKIHGFAYILCAFLVFMSSVLLKKMIGGGVSIFLQLSLPSCGCRSSRSVMFIKKHRDQASISCSH